jgi:BirA family biotin operon repressor/biotin-[acetyl-CoA-carboxylase] ligase
MLSPELPEGVVVFAEHQTAGRGQRGNRWASAPYLGLWFSLFLRPDLPLAKSASLTNWAAEAIAATIAKKTKLQPKIKPPNDIYVEGRKVGGVLVDTRTKNGRIEDAVVGLGINLNHVLEDFPLELRHRAGSLFMASGQRIDRTAFALALLRELDRTIEIVRRPPQSQPATADKAAVIFPTA